jgi:hypothetical protein
MFTIDSTITDLKVREKNILKILFSMNIHQIATPEMMLEDARSYVLFFRENKGRLVSYIALHLLTTNRRMYYSYSSNPFPDDQLVDAEEEALAFLEGLGAMIDEIDFSNMSDSAQDRWLNEQDIFSEKPVVEAQPAEPTSPEPEPEPQPVVTPLQTQPEIKPASQPLVAPVQLQPEIRPVLEPVAAPVASVAVPQQPQPEIPQILQPVVAPILPQPIAPAPPQPSVAPVQAQPVTPLILEPVSAPVQTQPVAAPAAPIVSTVQAHPTPAPKPVTPFVQPVLTPVYTEPVAAPIPQPIVPPMKPTPPRAPLQQQPNQQQKATMKRQQEIMQQAVTANGVKPSVKTVSREGQPAAGVVSRDKEALARLLASF